MSLAQIKIVREPFQVTVDIRDQGNGMSTEKLADIQAGRSGVGIRGMRERLRQFRGDMRIESDGTGTQIYSTIPVPTTAPSEEAACIPVADR